MSIRAAAGEQLDWSFGLRNGAGKYLTAETFGFRIATAASIMKKKQIWFLEQAEGDDHVYIRSHLNRYLYVDGDGNFKGDAEATTDEAALLIEAQDDGRWCLKSKKYGWYIGTDPSIERSAFEADKQEKHMWTVHLAMHPQICLKNVNRKTYVHLADGQLCTDEVIPWGDDATITIHFFDDDGTYGLISADGSYLSASGALMGSPNDSCKFIIVFNGGKVSFKSKSSGKFLTALGAKGTCKATKSAISKDELFHMEDSFPQIKLTAQNGKKLSIKGGIEVAASQTETTDNEIFQIEPAGAVGDDVWTIKSCNSKFWSVVDGAVHATKEKVEGDAEKFTIEWRGPNIALKSKANGKYLEQKLNGYIHAVGAEASADAKTEFCYEIVNRPKLVLRGEYGFVGTLPSGLLECNKSVPEIYTMHVTKGFCKISHANGKFWKIGANGISCSGETAEEYTMSLHEESMMCLMSGGKYFEGFQNGEFKCTGTKPGKSTYFEY
jgi:fascin 1/2